jgi:hypothetical protein
MRGLAGLAARRLGHPCLLHHLTTRFGIAKYAALSHASGAVRVGLENGRGRWFLTDGARPRLRRTPRG